MLGEDVDEEVIVAVTDHDLPGVVDDETDGVTEADTLDEADSEGL